MIIDTHTHIGYLETLKESEDNLINSMNENNIDFSLFSFLSGEFEEKDKDKSRLVKQLIAFDKQYEFYEKNRDKIGLILWIRPNTESNISEIDSFIKNHKESIFGLKIHPKLSKIKVNDSKIIPYLKLAEKYNLPICVHTEKEKYSKIEYLIDICKKWPHLNLIAAHGILGSNQKEMSNLVEKTQNLFVDTSWIDMDHLKYYKEKKLMDRIMFGSDNPYFGINTLKDKIYDGYFQNKIKLDKSSYEKLMYQNAIKIYNITLKKSK